MKSCVRILIQDGRVTQSWGGWEESELSQALSNLEEPLFSLFKDSIFIFLVSFLGQSSGLEYFVKNTLFRCASISTG